MRIPGLKTLRRLGQAIRGRFVPGAVVLGYHRIATPATDIFDQCVSPLHFAEHLELIRSLARPCGLKEIVDCSRSGRIPVNALAITFDDAYSDFAQTAVPLLRGADVPATLFAVSGVLGTSFWWDRLERAIGLPAGAKLADDGSGELNALYLRLRDLPPDAREAELARLELGAPGASDDPPRSVTAAELATLAAEPLLEIGAHSRTHPWLPSLSAAQRSVEIRRSKSDIEAIIGKPVSGFAFPYGGESRTLGEEVRSAGYDFACGSANGILFPRADPFTIPRLWVPDCDGERFASWLRRWLHA